MLAVCVCRIDSESQWVCIGVRFLVIASKLFHGFVIVSVVSLQLDVYIVDVNSYLVC